VDIDPVIALRTVDRDEPVRLALRRQAQEAGHGDVAGKLAGGAAVGRLAVLRDEAAIDQDGGAVGEAERRDHLIAGAAIARRRAEIELMVVGEAAAHADAVIVERLGCRERSRQRAGRGGNGGVALGDEAFLPEQALDLPGAEPEQGEERAGGEHAGPEQRAAARHDGVAWLTQSRESVRVRWSRIDERALPMDHASFDRRAARASSG